MEMSLLSGSRVPTTQHSLQSLDAPPLGGQRRAAVKSRNRSASCWRQDLTDLGGNDDLLSINLCNADGDFYHVFNQRPK